MSLLSRIRVPRDLDPSSRAGLMLAAVSVGLSYQPNLLTRKSVDQGIITGVSGLAAYTWGTSAHSALSALGARVGGRRGQVAGDAFVVLGSVETGALQAVEVRIASGTVTGLGSPEGPISVAAAPGLPTLVAAADGEVYALVSGDWQPRARGTAPTYPS